MQCRRLPRDVYRRLQATIARGAALEPEPPWSRRALRRRDVVLPCASRPTASRPLVADELRPLPRYAGMLYIR